MQNHFKLLFLIYLCQLIATDVSAQPTIAGMTNSGGDEFGLLFQTDINGNNSKIIHRFEGNSGAFPYFENLCETSNGKIYGLSFLGGKYNLGVLYTYEPSSGQYTKKLDFDGINTGSLPRSGLILAGNGKLYGMCSQGGKNNLGVIFEYNPGNDSFIKKIDFDGALNGRNPFGHLMQAGNGKLYGMTYQGGVYNEGTLFEFNPANDSFYKRVDFDGSLKGRNPFGSLMQASNGKLYGMTYQGGKNNLGVFFEFDPKNNTFLNTFDFDGNDHGSNPYSTCIEGPNGNLYAMTYLGGINNLGTLFEYDLSNDTIYKHFDFNGTNNGRNPYGNLTLHTDGKMYGVLPFGGSNNAGIIFEFDPGNNSFRKKLNIPGALAGKQPFGSLFLASDQKMYGTMNQGGMTNSGVLFQFDPADSSYTKKIDFGAAINGSNPFGNFMFASNHQLYGMTYQGGINNSGVIFSYDPKLKTYSKKFDFDGLKHGRNTYGSLIEAHNGKFYGMTFQGGDYDYGTLFEFDPATDSCIKRLDFDGSNGRNPYGNLLQANNGKLYGMTPYGGADDYGVLFEFDPANNTFFKLLDFYSSIGSNPFGNLIQATDGNLYGLTYQGGSADYGVLFSYDINDSIYTIKKEFVSIATGTYPQGSLLEGDNKKLYGLTQFGGTDNSGILFEYELQNNVLNKKMDFSGANGKNPTGNLMLSSKGHLYAMTQKGGNNNLGVLFEYDIQNDKYTKKLDFNGENGSQPFGSLIEYCIPSFDTITIVTCDSLISPSKNHTWTSSGVYLDTIPAALGCDSIIRIHLTILKKTFSNITISECKSYTAPDGQIYTSSGIKTAVILNHTGCDSIITINLDILNTKSTVYDTACRIYTAADGIIYKNSGIYLATINNSRACDSIITIYLTIHNVNTSVTRNDSILTAQATGALYQWGTCNNGFTAIPGETNQNFITKSNGQYAVIVSENNCTDTSACIAVTELSIDNFELMPGIIVYPNPTDRSVHIDLGKPYNMIEMTLMDIYGKTIEKRIFNPTQHLSFELEGPAGVYLLKIVSGSQSKILQVIKH